MKIVGGYDIFLGMAWMELGFVREWGYGCRMGMGMSGVGGVVWGGEI